MALGDGIRRNIATVSKEERDLFVAAIIELNNRYYPGNKNDFPAGGVSKWFKQDEIHQATHVHQQTHFFPWHRELINRFEVLLREVNPLLSLHYWDWNQDPTNIPDGDGGFINLFTSDFMGSSTGFAGTPFAPDAALFRPGLYNPAPIGDAFRDDNIHGLTPAPGYELHANPVDPPQNLKRDLQAGVPPVGQILRNPFNVPPDWTPVATPGPGTVHWSTDSEIINATDFQELNRWMQGVKGNAHGLAHSWIGATILDAHTSFRDPFVFLIHSNLDRLWAMWQRKLQSVRLDRNHIYDPISSDINLNSPLQPWAGTGDWPTRPWAAPENEQTFPANNKDSKDLSIVIPPSYDTAPHSSYIVTERDSFSTYELDTTHSYPQAFQVIYDGFTPNEIGVGIFPAISFLDGPNGTVIGSIHGVNPSVDGENTAAPDTPQRITFTFDVNFDDSSAFPLPPTPPGPDTRDIYLRATLGGQVDIAPIRLTNQPNPYMIDIQGGNPAWLSADVRVFQLRPGEKVHVSSTTTMGNPDINTNAPYTYIQDLLTEFRGFGNSPTSPFENILRDEQASQLELSRTVGGIRVMNFAVAKVRYRATAAPATDVRVFFRTFNTMVSALDYRTDSNYPRRADGLIPLPGFIGTEIASIPYFAEARAGSSAAQADDTNKQTINASGNEAYMYFGCWLDFNQPAAQVETPGGGHANIINLVRGIHQCMVAEIRFQPGATDPIIIGATPSSSDHLAQRNLAIAESDNPGIASTHVVQHTLLVKPSKVFGGNTDFNMDAVVEQRGSSYDELVIRWHNLPRDTKATLFFPEWNVDEVLLLAAALRQGPKLLKKVDDNTLECIVTDISYIPIPGNNLKPFAGLITLQLPQGVRDGQLFKVDVQQHSGLHLEKTFKDKGNNEGHEIVYSLSKRKVLGAFRLTIPVKMGEGLLKKEIRNLAVLRYIAQSIPVNDRWHPVFTRYIGQIADKVKGLGVDPDLIKPSPDDPGIPGAADKDSEHCFTGKVCEVMYNCFGNFEGFVLATCCDNHLFKCCENAIGEIALRACKERLLISVCFEKKNQNKICKIIVHC